MELDKVLSSNAERQKQVELCKWVDYDLYRKAARIVDSEPFEDGDAFNFGTDDLAYRLLLELSDSDIKQIEAILESRST